jgi:hypothetical protein
MANSIVPKENDYVKLAIAVLKRFFSTVSAFSNKKTKEKTPSTI